MFGRRKGSKKVKPPVLVNQSTSVAGTTAAQLAFFQQPTNAAPLSSAAAAAALRSYTSTPEPVGNIQTKRMVRRASTSSQGSGSMATGNGRPGLVRTNSNGSMTERTFRTPSPARRNGTSPAPQAPPVPALPKTIERPSSSLDAPQRITSPTPAQGQRSASADQMAAAPPESSRQAKRLSNVAEREEADRAHVNFARNFSRRDISPPASPTISTAVATNASRPRTAEGMEPSTRTSSMSSFTLSPRQQPLQGTRPISAAGNSFPRASFDSQRSYSAQSGGYSGGMDKVYDPNSRSFVPRVPPVRQQPALQAARRAKSMETVYDPNSRTFVPKTEPAGNQAAPASTTSTSQSTPVLAPRKQRSFPAGNTGGEPPTRNPARFSSFVVEPRTSPASPRAAATLHKQPSIVREDTEAEKQAEIKTLPLGQSMNGTRAAQPTVLPAKTYVTSPVVHARSASLDVPRPALDAGTRGRNVSISPQRSAHFSASPILKPELHAPPPRDLSPAKSAMKQSPSLRAISPTMASETSETPSLSALDGLSTKKKKSRVSFDEQPQEITAPAAPATTMIGSLLRDRSNETDLDGGMMQPRPALPSFGSVRRDRAEKVTEMPPERHEVSSDHAIGGILRNSMDPIPPEVTSKDGAGYVSDESSEADVPVPSTGAVESAKLEDEKVPLTESGKPMVRDFGDATKPADRVGALAVEDNDVPSIAFIPPTPGVDEGKDVFDQQVETKAEDETRGRNSMEGISIPGGWKDDVERTPTPTVPSTVTVQPSSEPPSLERKSSSEDSAATMTVTPIQITQSPQPLSDIDEDTDGSAEFSDAFEDPSDLEDEGGFASLDAIVESPIPSPMEQKSIMLPLGQEMPASPTRQAAKTPEVFTSSVPALIQAANLAPDSSPPASPTTGGGDWQEATTYWSQLSKEKRLQMEREALSSDEELKPVPKKVKPKKTQIPADTASTSPTTPVTRQQPALPTLKKTMRAQTGPVAADPADGGVHMRSSMRTDGRMRPSSRDGPPPANQQLSSAESRGALQKKTIRPTSAGGPPTSPGLPWQAPRRPQLTSRPSDDSVYSQTDVPLKKTVQRPKAEPAKAPPPRPEPPKVSARLQKELAKAGDSDSESSFKKRRKGASSVDTTGRYSMRRSMRAGSADPTPAPSAAASRPESPTSDRGSRFGFRSMSPTFGRNKASSVRDSSQDSGLRTTLRGPTSKATSPRDGQAAGMKASLRAPSSFAKASNKQPAAQKSRLKSRFADSDDEDEDAPRPTFFKSRFADSDDESEPGSPRLMRADPPPRTDLAPVRGIPRRKDQEDGDSTDLEEEGDDNPAVAASKRFTALIGPHPGESDKIMAAARRNLGMSPDSSPPQHNVKEGEALHKGSLRQRPSEETPSPTAKAKDVEIIPQDKKRRSFMSSILGRNRKSSSSIPQVRPSSPPPPMPTSPVVAPVTPQTPTQERPQMPSSPPTSYSRAAKIERPVSPTGMPTGKLIRKESYQMWMQRASSSELLNAGAPASPEATAKLQALQERDLNTFVRPPSPPIPETETTRPNVGERPATSDGVSPESIKLARTMRPDLNRNSKSGPLTNRRVQIQAGEEGSEPGERETTGIYSQKTGKKKKFGMLRKAFGLKD